MFVSVCFSVLTTMVIAVVIRSVLVQLFVVWFFVGSEFSGGFSVF